MGRARLSENFLVAPTVSNGHPTMGSGRTVMVYKRGTTQPIGQTLYATENGSSVLTQPLSTDAGGSVMAWVTYPEPVDLVVSGAPLPYPTEFVSNDDSLGQISGGTAKFDGKQSLAGSVSAGAPIVTVPIGGDFAGFTAADVGKLIVVIQLTFGTETPFPNVHAETNVLVGTIASVLDPTHVIASTNATANVAGNARVLWGSDDTAALQALFDTVQPTSSSPTGAEIRLKRGIAMTSGPLNLINRHGTRLIGAGAADAPNIPWHGTTIVGCHTGSILRVSMSHGEVVGIGLDGAGKLASKGLELAGGQYFSTMRQVRVGGCGTGLYGANEQFGNSFHDLTTYFCTDGVNFTPSGTGIQKVTFYNLASEFNASTGIVLSGDESINFYGGSSQQNQHGVRLTNNAYLCRFDGFMFEGNTIDAVNITTQGGGTLAGQLARFTSCRFIGGAITAGRAVNADAARYCTWDGCSFENFPVGGGAVIVFTSAFAQASLYNSFLPNCIYNSPASPALFGGYAGVNFGLGSTARITKSTDTSIANNASFPSNTLAFDTVVWDPDLLLQPTLHPFGFFVQRPGTYRFTFSARFAGGAGGGVRQLGLYANGAGPPLALANNDNPSATQVSDLVVTTSLFCPIGTWVDAQAFQNSGSAINLLHVDNFSPVFTCEQVA